MHVRRFRSITCVVNCIPRSNLWTMVDRLGISKSMRQLGCGIMLLVKPWTWLVHPRKEARPCQGYWLSLGGSDHDQQLFSRCKHYCCFRAHGWWRGPYDVLASLYDDGSPSYLFILFSWSCNYDIASISHSYNNYGVIMSHIARLYWWKNAVGKWGRPTGSCWNVGVMEVLVSPYIFHQCEEMPVGFYSCVPNSTTHIIIYFVGFDNSKLSYDVRILEESWLPNP